MLTRLRAAPAGHAGHAETEARRGVVLALLATLRPLVADRPAHPRDHGAVRQHPDGAIFLSFFRRPDSVICAATLLAEIGDCRARYTNGDALAADGGQSRVAVSPANASTPPSATPATTASERRQRARRRHPPLAPLGRRPYAAARARGHDHPRAIRTLGRAWCRVLWRCWQDHTPYNPTRHGSAPTTLPPQFPRTG